MKILIIGDNLPFPIIAGGDQAVVNMIDGLQNLCEIHFIYKSNSKRDDIGFAKKRWRKVIFHPFVENKSISFYLSRLAAHFAHNYQQDTKNAGCIISPFLFYTKHYIEHIQTVISLINPDIIQTEFYPNLELVYTLPKSVKKIYIQHEIHYTINEQRYDKNNDWGCFQKFSISKLKADEIMAMNQYDAVFAFTKSDCASLQKSGVLTQVFNSPVGIKKPIHRNPCRFDNKLIFVGAGAHTPNVEGLLWFLDKVWPIIMEEHNNLKLNVIGKWNSEQINQLSQYKNVVFKGFVSSLQEEYDGAIAIVPILRGSGMRMKIIDAVNYGSCFISTSVGANDMHFEDGRDCFIADNPRQFAEKLNCMIKDNNIRTTFYNNSEKIALEYYSIERLVDKRMQLYKEIINQKRDVL